MNKHFLMGIGLMLFVLISNAQVIPNAGFDNWTNMGSYSDPTFWSSYNSFLSSGGLFTCEQGMPGATGPSYLKLTVKNTGTINSGLAMSSPSFSTGFSPGFAYNARPANFTGKWQYLVSPNDTSIAEVLFFKWNTTTLTSDLIGVGFQELTSGSVTSWTNFSIPISYMSSDTPDSALILFAAGIADVPIINDYLYVDDIAFTGNIPTAIHEASLNQDLFTISPNPLKTHTTIHFNQEQKNSTIRLFDMAGKVLRTVPFSGNDFTLEKGGLKSGIYFIHIIDESKKAIVKKLVIQ